jgi:hypothetical protein
MLHHNTARLPQCIINWQQQVSCMRTLLKHIAACIFPCLLACCNFDKFVIEQHKKAISKKAGNH